MPIKRICRKCYDMAEEIVPGWKPEWDAHMENRWNHNRLVRCRAIDEAININDQPPPQCFYILEHLMWNDKQLPKQDRAICQHCPIYSKSKYYVDNADPNGNRVCELFFKSRAARESVWSELIPPECPYHLEHLVKEESE